MEMGPLRSSSRGAGQPQGVTRPRLPATANGGAPLLRFRGRRARGLAADVAQPYCPAARPPTTTPPRGMSAPKAAVCVTACDAMPRRRHICPLSNKSRLAASHDQPSPLDTPLTAPSRPASLLPFVHRPTAVADACLTQIEASEVCMMHTHASRTLPAPRSMGGHVSPVSGRIRTIPSRPIDAPVCGEGTPLRARI